jgi:GNAT superfamily N-acetyltransferase
LSTAYVIRLVEGNLVLAAAQVFVQAGSPSAQLLDVEVHADHRRKGVGTQLVTAIRDQLRKLGNARGEPVRVLWCVLGQKRHIVARAFLTRQGFQHVASPAQVLRSDDAMVYLCSFD